MPITAERLEVDVQADTSGARRELDSFSKATGRSGKYADQAGGKAAGMGKKFSAAGALVKTAAGSMVAAMAGKTIMAASDLNEVLSKTGVVFGPQAKGVTDAAQQMADKFGMSKTVFLDAASGMGLVGKAAGMTRKEAAGLGVDFSKLAADASSFHNVPIEEALAAMKSGLTGEAEPLRRFGVLLNEAAVQTEAVRLGLIKTGGEMTEGQKVQARASLITKGMADAQGDLARTQGSVSNRLKEIRGRLQNFAADMGAKALPAAEKFLGALIKAPKVIKGVVTSVRDWVNNNQSIKPVLDLVVAGVRGLIDGVRELPGMFSRVNSAVQGFIDKHAWIKPLLDTAAVAVGAFVAAFLAVMGVAKVVAVLNAIRMAIMGVSAAMLANPVGLIIAGLIALGVAVYAAYQRFAPFRALVDSVGASLRTGLGVALDWVKAKWQEWGPAIMSVLSGLWTGVRTYIGFVVAYWRTAFTVVSTVLKVAFDLIAGYVRFMLPIWKAGFTMLANVAKNIFNTIKGVIRGALQVIKGVVNVVMGVIRGDWSRVWKGIQQIVGGVWGVIKSLVKGAIGVVKSVISGGLGMIRGAWSSGWNALKGILTGVWNGLKNGVRNGVTAVVNLVKGIPGKVTAVFSGAGTLLLDAGKAIIKGLGDGIDSMIGSVKGKLKGLTDMIPDLKGPYSKDLKLLRRNGRAIIKGLVKGFTQEEPQVRKYLKGLTKWVEQGFGGATEKRLVKRIKASGKRLRKARAREAALDKRMTAAQAARAKIVETRDTMVDAMRTGISSQANVLNAGNSAGAIRDSLQAQVAKVKTFVANLQAMRKAGFSNEVINQVASAGIEGGAEVAKILSAATSTERTQINQAFASINAMASSASAQLGNDMYGSGIRAADGLIAGLKKQQKSIEAQMVKIAKGMQKAIKKALGIKSPSRVMARLMGFVGAGITRGLDATRKGVARAATRMGATVTGGVTAGLGPTPGLPGRPGGPGGLTPASTGGAGNGGDVHFHFNTQNPVAEPESRTTNKALERVTSLGLV